MGRAENDQCPHGDRAEDQVLGVADRTSKIDELVRKILERLDELVEELETQRVLEQTGHL